MRRGGHGRDLESVDYDLRSLDAEVRRLAVERMSELPELDALPRLAHSLGDPVWRVRRASIDRLLALARVEAVDAVLIDALTDDVSAGLRNAALEALVRRGPLAVPQISAALRGAPSERRHHLIQALAGIGDESAEAPVRTLLNDDDPAVAAAAAAALGIFGGAASAADLFAAAMCEHAAPLLRSEALRSLARLEVGVDPVALESLLEDPALCPAALSAIATSDDPRATELLLKRLESPSTDAVGAAVTGLITVIARHDLGEVEWLGERIRDAARGGAGLVARVSSLLELPNREVRWAGLQFLGIVGAPEAAVAILERCRDESVADLARTTLSMLGPAVEPYLDASWGALDASLRLEACRTFGVTSGDVGFARLRGALEDPDLAVRVAAIEALARHPAPDVVEPLAQRLGRLCRESEQDARDERVAIVDALVEVASGGERANPAQEPTSRVVTALNVGLEDAADPARVAAAQVLGRIGRPCDEALIALLLQDPSAEVRRAAIIALSRSNYAFGIKRLRFALLDEEVGVRCAAAAALGGNPVADVFEDLLWLYREDEHVRVQAAALRALAQEALRRPVRHVAALRFVQSVDLEDPVIAIAAAEALSRLGGVGAVEVALGLLHRVEPEVVQAAVDCVATHGEPAHFDRLLGLVAHPDWSVRCGVVRSFAERRVVRAVPLILRRLDTEADPMVRDVILQTLARLDG